MHSSDTRVITIPNTKQLEKKFKKVGLLDFAKHSGLIRRIAGKKCNVQGLNFAIRSATTDYQFNNSSYKTDVHYWESVENKVKIIILGKNHNGTNI